MPSPTPSGLTTVPDYPDSESATSWVALSPDWSCAVLGVANSRRPTYPVAVMKTTELAIITFQHRRSDVN